MADVETLTINGTTYTIVDSGARAYAAGLCAYNLLDNSNFLDPINQRGLTTYTGAGYTIDRWRNWYTTSSVSIGDKGLVVTAEYIFQFFPDGFVSADKTYTLAAKLSDGTITRVIGTFDGQEHSSGKCGFYYSETAQANGVYLAPGYTYEWAALYEGEYTADTLPPYVPKGYAVEQLACQRYFCNIFPVNTTAAQQVGAMGIATSSTQITFFVATPSSMRKNPSVSISGLKARDVIAGTNIDITSVYSSSVTANGIWIFATVEGATKGQTYWLRSEKGTLSLSADI